MLDICLLGTGGVMPLPGRWLSSLLIRCQGRMILIDCGEGTQVPLKKLHWGIKTIDAILFTHYHADHIAGLPGLLLTIGNSGRTEPLSLLGPPGLKRVVEGLTIIAPELPFELTLSELPDTDCSEKRIGEIHLKSIPVNHTVSCFAYCFELNRKGKFDVERAKKLGIPTHYWKTLQKGIAIFLEGEKISPEMVLGQKRKGIKVCYCTDTRPTSGLVQFINGSDLFICEGMYGNDDSYPKALEKKHMLFSEAALLASQGKVKELWLTHYSPSVMDPEEYMDAARALFTNTKAGIDLLMSSLKFAD
ncbi:metal-dependent hydrolase, beta-lactamase superfamily III [Desulfosporosinus orientis DSM 765]|uniref:Ribonuclease Z n=1 Tax=Desulfosporosinus orientis (strain ATCC 19365 / DSM 765 / NCIMB 8382 / VKM B-1628 / Singapore I) TaxID=768706 RepID=G7WFZ1_DESOD|nr:ribonuclease Z [Desulfosporosinus orientis]AET69506.1 metal-dependent hydrolase, beta-lactamase superfamily III [Desulfosporosinus orientis DSM 765]